MFCTPDIVLVFSLALSNQPDFPSSFFPSCCDFLCYLKSSKAVALVHANPIEISISFLSLCSTVTRNSPSTGFSPQPLPLPLPVCILANQETHHASTPCHPTTSPQAIFPTPTISHEESKLNIYVGIIKMCFLPNSRKKNKKAKLQRSFASLNKQISKLEKCKHQCRSLPFSFRSIKHLRQFKMSKKQVVFCGAKRVKKKKINKSENFVVSRKIAGR